MFSEIVRGFQRLSEHNFFDEMVKDRDPFGHSEGQFSLKAKSLEMGSRGLPGLGAKKVTTESKTDSKLTFSIFGDFLTLF